MPRNKASSKQLPVLALLAMSRDRTVLRGDLIKTLWADRSDERAKACLRQVLYQLRKYSPPLVEVESRGATLRLAAHVRVDVEEFGRAVKANRLAEALDWHRGDFLAGFDAEGAIEFDRWARAERIRLRRTVVEVATRHVTEAFAARSHEEARRVLDRIREAAGAEFYLDKGYEPLRVLDVRVPLSSPPEPETSGPAVSNGPVDSSLVHLTDLDSASAVPPSGPASRTRRRAYAAAVAGILAAAVSAVAAVATLAKRSEASNSQAVVYAVDAAGRALRAELRVANGLGDTAAIAIPRRLFAPQGDDRAAAPAAISPIGSAMALVKVLDSRPRVVLRGINADSVDAAKMLEEGHPSFSPDGRFVTLVAAADPRSPSAVHVIVRNTVSGDSRALTSGPDHRDAWPKWSGDGTRIAFIRRGFREIRPQVCWVAFSGGAPTCSSAMRDDALEATMIGWIDAGKVLVHVRYANANRLEVFDVANNSRAAFGTWEVETASISPDGRIVACVCAAGPGQRSTWWLVPVENPGSRRGLTIDRSFDIGSVSVFWRFADASAGGWLATLRIDRSVLEVTIGDSVLYHVQAFSRSGVPIAIGVLSWAVSDTTVARVDSAGILHGKSPGSVLLVADAGGWLSDTIQIAIRQARTGIVHTERWDEAWHGRWRPFGVPQPHRVAAGMMNADGTLSIPGDGVFESGVYSTYSWDPSEGIGVAAKVFMPLTADRGQHIRILVGPHWEGRAATAWDRVTGPPPVAASDVRRECGFSYPLFEGSEGRSTAGGHTALLGPFRLPAPFGDEWHEIRVQVRADGRCEVWLDGSVMWRSPAAPRPNGAYRVTLMGAALDTRLFVGGLTIWTGDAMPANPLPPARVSPPNIVLDLPRPPHIH